jgi:hypothetical protein
MRAVLLVLTLSGCSRLNLYLQTASAQHADCPSDLLRISDVQLDSDRTRFWIASGCHRRYACMELGVTSKEVVDAEQVSCSDDQAALDERMVKQMVQRVAAASGCARDEVVPSLTTEDTFLTERTYEVSTCNHPYVCHATEAHITCTIDHATERLPRLDR